MKGRPKILAVDDRPENLLALGQLLKPHDAEILEARSGPEALELLLAHDFALALLDVHLPGMDGFELAELMRGTERTRDVPIVFVTAAGYDRARAFKGYELGAVAFLAKPIEPLMLDNKVRTFLRLYRQNAERAEALERAEEALQVRDRLLSLVSHDLRNPLGALMLGLGAVERQLRAAEEAPLCERLVPAVERMLRQAERMESLIDELLDVARAQAGRPTALAREDVDLVAISRALADEHQRSSPQHRLEVRTRAPRVVGRWDRERLERVVGNLLSNAIKYSPRGGAVLVEIELVHERQQSVAIVRVTDEGIGIPAPERARVFEWFARATNAERSNIRGTGIGLAGARQIVELHGGSIAVESEEGRGSTFTVRLPIEPPASTADARAPSDSAALHP